MLAGWFRFWQKKESPAAPRKSPWWSRRTPTSLREPRGPLPAEQPDPRFRPGTFVRLVGRPNRLRRVLRTEWHRHQQTYVYVIETSAPPPFEPYWFAESLEEA